MTRGRRVGGGGEKGRRAIAMARLLCGRRAAATLTVVLGALLAPAATAQTVTFEYCFATNPPSGAPNPCRLAVDETYVYEASGDWELRVERRNASGRWKIVEMLSSEADAPASGGAGLFRSGDLVTVKALTPGSRVSVRDADPSSLTSDAPEAEFWPSPGGYDVVEDGCVKHEDQCLTSKGAVIRYTLVLPKGASPKKPVPLIIAAHGFDGNRRGYLGQLREGWGWPAFALANGYALLVFDARGYGDSGGDAKLNDPEFEGADVKALIDRMATEPSIAQESPGDPRVGMVGVSYGGEIQLVAAALDDRIDAIVPDRAWNNLYNALVPHGAVKTGWGTLLPLAQLTTLGYPGFMEMKDPTRWERGSIDPEITKETGRTLVTGDTSKDFRERLERLGPWNLFEGFDTPTMLLHGQQDTAFGPSQAAANFDALRRVLPAAKLRMRWYCGGHGTCKPNYSEPAELRTYRDGMRFLNRWVKGDGSVDTGPTFAYLTPDGHWQTDSQFPPEPTATLTASGSGRVAVGGEPGTGGFHEALPYADWQAPRPAQTSLKIDIPRGDGTIVGSPKIVGSFTATGTGYGVDTGETTVDTGKTAVVYLRLIDKRTQTVLGNQTTPVVLQTDGQPHEVSVNLEPVVWRLGAKDQLALEVLGSSTLFEPHRGAAVIDLKNVDIEVPVTAGP